MRPLTHFTIAILVSGVFSVPGIASSNSSISFPDRHAFQGIIAVSVIPVTFEWEEVFLLPSPFAFLMYPKEENCYWLVAIASVRGVI